MSVLANKPLFYWSSVSVLADLRGINCISKSLWFASTSSREMFIPAEKDQILMPLENGTESLILPDCRYNNGISSILELPKSSPLLTICTDVNVATDSKRNELELLISNLEDEIDGLRLKQNSLDGKRREILNKILDLKGSIRVFSRIRPFLSTDRKQVHEHMSTGPEKVVVRSAGSRKEFEFDKVFSQASAQEDVFVEVEPILRSALDGHNVCILAYGQTGTGKTFTMEGTNEQAGIVPRAMKELFRRATSDKLAPLTFSMSMLEVYMGSLRDLLAPKPSRRAYEPATRCNLNIQTDPKGMVEIEGLTEVSIADFSKASWWYTKGKRVRSTSCTRVNDMSSRSHCLTRITITQHGDVSKGERASKLWMVDLGGSERLLKTGASGLTLDEGRAINLSLSALGDVIAALRRKRGHVPYRNSKLTQILKDSLGYGSKVLMLVHASPCEEDVAETICSLSFAKRARAVESNQELPEDIKKQKQKKVEELSNMMREAEEEHKIVMERLHKAEFLLSENKKLFSSTDQNVEEEEEKSPTSGKDRFKEDTPQTPDKATRRSSLPRFMTSTMASRQRQNASEKYINFGTRILRSGTRSSVQLSGSQSIISLDPRLKALLRNSGTKPPRDGGTKVGLTESPRRNNGDLSASVMSRNKVVTSSNPSFRAPISRHRRRMSDFN